MSISKYFGEERNNFNQSFFGPDTPMGGIRQEQKLDFLHHQGGHKPLQRACERGDTYIPQDHTKLHLHAAFQ